MKRTMAIFQQDLMVGGIQRSLISILNDIDYNEFDVDLYLFDKGNFYLDSLSNVNIIYIKKCSKFMKFLPFNLFKRLRKNFVLDKKYDIAIDFNGYQHDTAFGVLKSASLKKVLWIHSDLECRYMYDRKYRFMFNISKKKFSLYDNFVFVSKGAFEGFNRVYPLIDKKVHIIPNSVNSKKIITESKETCDLVVDDNEYNFVTLGRLIKSKGLDILLENMRDLLRYREDFHLYIIGDGKEKDNLLKLINDYKLNNFVTLLGQKNNPYKYMTKMDGLVFTSRYEGQGLVVLEAQVLGLDIFITKNLEKYNIGITGYENILLPLKEASKKNKEINLLQEYNSNSKKELDKLLKE